MPGNVSQTDQPPVVVIGKGANALGVIRSLHGRGVDVFLVVTRRGDAAGYSRYLRKTLLFPTSEMYAAPDKFLEFLEKEVPAGSVVIPAGDPPMLWISMHRQKIRERYLVHCLREGLAESILNKNTQIEMLESTGVDFPVTLFGIDGDTGGGQFDNREKLLAMDWPVIIKPTVAEYVRHIGKNVILRSRAEADSFVAKHAAILSHLQAQEFIPGDDRHLWVCNCFFDEHSRLKQAFTFQRLGLWPAHRGTTSYAISVANEEVCALSQKIGRDWGFTGPGMFEFKYDERKSVYRYLELNPRLGQCNWFDCCCGIDNVWYLYLLSQGQPLPGGIPRQRDGVVCHSLLADIHARLKDRQSFFSIARLYMRDLFKPHVGQFFSLYDPLPAFVASVYAAKKFLGFVPQYNR